MVKNEDTLVSEFLTRFKLSNFSMTSNSVLLILFLLFSNSFIISGI